MDEQTRKLLEECSSGCKMAVNSMEQVSEYIKDTKLKELADSFTEKHRELEAETAALLNDAGNDEKAPGAAASTFAWFTTEIKLAVNSDNTHIAKLLMDGCNMGIKTLGEKLHQYSQADKSAVVLTQKIINENEDMMKKLQEFL